MFGRALFPTSSPPPLTQKGQTSSTLYGRSDAMHYHSCPPRPSNFNSLASTKITRPWTGLLQRLVKGRTRRINHSREIVPEGYQYNAKPSGLRPPMFQSWQRCLYGVNFYVSSHLSRSLRSCESLTAKRSIRMRLFSNIGDFTVRMMVVRVRVLDGRRRSRCALL